MKRVAALVVIVAVLATGAWWMFRDTDDAPRPPETTPVGTAARVGKSKTRRGAQDAAAHPTGHASLVVRATDAASRSPLRRAVVYVADGAGDDWRAETDGDGAARFDDVAAGAAVVRAEAAGHESATSNTSLAKDVKATLDVALRAAATVEGVVLDADGRPVAGATVTLMRRVEKRHADVSWNEDQVVATVVADASGRWRIDDAPASETLLARAVAPRSYPQTSVVKTSAAGAPPAAVEFRLDATGVLRGHVRDASGTPVDVAWVHAAWTEPAPGVADVNVDDDGAFAIADVPTGRAVTLTAGAPEWSDALPVTVEIPRGEAEFWVDVRMRKPATLVVRVADSTARPVGNATLVLDGSGWGFRAGGREGECVRTAIAPGAHKLLVKATGFVSATRDLTLDDGARCEVDVALAPGVAIKGTVVDADGRPVAKAAVRIVGEDDSNAYMTSNSGEFAIDSVAPGPHALQASWYVSATSTSTTVQAPCADARLVLARMADVRFRVPAAGAPAGKVPVVVDECGRDAAANLPVEGGRRTWQLMAFPNDAEPARCLASPDAVALRFCVGEFAPIVVPISPTPGATTDLGVLPLDAGVSIRVRVVDSEGRAVPDADAAAVLGATVRRKAAATGDGTFAIPHMAAGPALVVARAGDRFGAAVVGPSDAGGAAVVVRRPGVVRGTVVAADGTPVPGAVVFVRPSVLAVGTDGQGRAVADEHGAFSMSAPAGRVVVATDRGSVEADVPEEGETSVRVVTK